jgi:hypothetical protein
MDKELWYFAYGSNLDPEQLRERIDEWSNSTRHVLKGYRLVFNVISNRWRGYTANIFATGNLLDKVYGVKYQITRQQLDRLTKCEGIDPQYIPQIEAYAYVFQAVRPGSKPPPDYLDTITRGLVFHGYGTDVVAEVRKITNA